MKKYELRIIEEVVQNITRKYPDWPATQIRHYSNLYLKTYGQWPEEINYFKVEHYILSKMLWSQK